MVHFCCSYISCNYFFNHYNSFTFVSCHLLTFITSSPVACPILAKTPQVLVIHGEGDGIMDHMKVGIPFGLC